MTTGYIHVYHKLTITLSGLQIFHRIHFWNMESSWRELPGTEFIRMMGWLKYSSHCLQFWMSERRSPLNGWWSCSITRQSIQAWNIHKCYCKTSMQFSFVKNIWLRTNFMAYNSAKYNTYQNQNIDPIPNTKLLRCINICQTIFLNETRAIKEKSD